MYNELLQSDYDYIFQNDNLIPPMDEPFIRIYHGRGYHSIITRRDLLNQGYDLQANSIINEG